LDRISERLDLFRGRRDGEARQQTLRATIAWSYDLLPPEERRSFARLSVFAGGCTAGGAERVCDLELDRLQSLAAKSLIQYQDGRLTMLETVREYAREQLVDSGELVGIGRRHLEWVLALAEVAGPKLRGAEAFVPEARELELELDNIRAALGYALDHQATDEALRLATALLSFWTYSGRQDEGLRWLEEGLTQESDTRGKVHADSTRAAGVLADLAGLHDRAIALSSEAVVRYRALGDQVGEANALRDLGSGYALVEDWTSSFARLRESIALFEHLDDQLGLARALNNLGNYELLAGSLERAAELMTRALEIQASLPIPGAGTATQHSLGMVALERRDIVTARELFVTSLRDISLGGTHAAGNVRYITTYLGALAAVAALEHDSVRAGHLWGAVTSIEAERGVQIDGADRARYLKAMTRVAGPSFDPAMEAGRLLTLEEAVREALAHGGAGLNR
jgi:tetratricopeptide (TPR) repeat protein